MKSSRSSVNFKKKNKQAGRPPALAFACSSPCVVSILSSVATSAKFIKCTRTSKILLIFFYARRVDMACSLSFLTFSILAALPEKVRSTFTLRKSFTFFKFNLETPTYSYVVGTRSCATPMYIPARTCWGERWGRAW